MAKKHLSLDSSFVPSVLTLEMGFKNNVLNFAVPHLQRIVTGFSENEKRTSTSGREA